MAILIIFLITLLFELTLERPVRDVYPIEFTSRTSYIFSSKTYLSKNTETNIKTSILSTINSIKTIKANSEDVNATISILELYATETVKIIGAYISGRLSRSYTPFVKESELESFQREFFNGIISKVTTKLGTFNYQNYFLTTFYNYFSESITPRTSGTGIVVFTSEFKKSSLFKQLYTAVEGTSNNSTSGYSNSKLTGGQVAGIGVGIFVLIACFITIPVLVRRCKRKAAIERVMEASLVKTAAVSQMTLPTVTTTQPIALQPITPHMQPITPRYPQTESTGIRYPPPPPPLYPRPQLSNNNFQFPEIAISAPIPVE